jgi:CubicO group peptidase (beta-lactamase class C family)
MSSDRTLDAEAIDLRPVAEGVVERHRAAPCAVVGAAIRGPRSDGIAERAGLAPTSTWRFGWGAAGRLWTVPPPGSTDPSRVGPTHSRAAAPVEAPLVAAHHVFDLASVSKPVIALTVARLQREGVLHRDEKLADFIPALAATPSGPVPLDLFLAHRAGLEAHREFFVKRHGASQPLPQTAIEQAAVARRAECNGAPPEEGFAPVYSDLGYILVGAALEARTGRALDELVSEQVTRPLGLTLGSIRRLERSEPMLDARVVPTEEVAWRGGVVRGVVHDENAWVIAGTGCAGHAGLFADVWSVVRLGTSLLEAWSGRKDRWLTQADLEPLLRRRPGGTHRAGFDSASGEGSMSGRLFGPATFGHLGFTGTSLWIDPERSLVGVLLTNRVHPTRDNPEPIRAARPAAYDALYQRMTSG